MFKVVLCTDNSALQAATILVAMASGKKKYLATKILAKVANWRPNGLKEKLT